MRDPILRGGIVPVPRWIIPFRVIQFLFAVIVLGLVAYAFTYQNGGELRPALIINILAACLTVFPILFLTFAGPWRKLFHDPRASLSADRFGSLIWFAAFVALACYLHFFRQLVKGVDVNNMAHATKRHDGNDVIRQRLIIYASARAHKAWRCALAADVFAGLEFLLFLATTDIFTYYYHLYLTGTPYSTPLNGTHTFNNKPTTTTTTPSTLDSNPTHAAHPLAQIPEIPPSLASTTYPAPTPDTAGTYAPHGHHGNGVPLLGGTHFENHGPGASAPVPEQVGGRPQTGYEGDGGMGGEGRGPGYSVV